MGMLAIKNWLVAVFLVGYSTLIQAGQCDEIDDRLASLESGFHSTLQELARQATQDDLTSEAAATRAWAVPRSSGGARLYLPVEERGLAGEGLEAARWRLPEGCEEAWRLRFQAIRSEQAEKLYELAKDAAAVGRYSLAWRLVNRTLRQNPDHEQVRRTLGYVRQDGAWRRTYDVAQEKKGNVWDDRWGWIMATRAPRYEQGLRYFGGRWISTKEEAKRRADINQGWIVYTENYEVRTNHSQEAAVQLALQLEELRALWLQTFIRFYLPPERIADVIAGRRRLPNRSARHRVVFFRSREEYNAFLLPSQPQIEITLGIYFDREETAFFFAGDDQDSGTIRHEATHQLFQEARPAAKQIARWANFWMVEGVACYMESLEEIGEGVYSLGAPHAGRLPAARNRALEERFYVPLGPFCSYGMTALQTDPHIARLYSQASGLATFFMHAEEGAYQDAFVGALAGVYAGANSPQLLKDLTGQEYEALDRAYFDWLQNLSTAAK